MNLTWRVYFNRKYLGHGIWQSDMFGAVGVDELERVLEQLRSRKITQWRIVGNVI